jgi:hypothetical protein
MNLGCDNRVQPPSDDFPDSYQGLSVKRRSKLSIYINVLTLEYPGGFVHKHCPKRLWVVCFETLDHELDRGIILTEETD